MRYLNFCLAVLLIAGCVTNPKPDTLLSIWNDATPLDLSKAEEEMRIQLVLPRNGTATLVLQYTSVGIQYPDEQGPNEEVEHVLFDSLDNSSIQEVRISKNKRFVFVKANVVAYSTGNMPQTVVSVMNVYDLKQRKVLDSIDVEFDEIQKSR